MKISNTLKICVWVIVVLLLASMLAFPLGLDQSIYEAGGAAVGLRGAIPFRDFLELKQPLIFYIYSVATVLFGRHEWSPRLLDAIYQFGALYVFYRLLRRFSGNEMLALISVLLYAVTYVGSGFWMTMEPESYALLPQLGLLYATLSLDETEHPRLWTLVLIAAVSLWALVMMKITMILMGAGVVLYLLVTRAQHPRRKLRFFIYLCGAFVVLMAASLAWLSHVDALNNLILSFHWLSSYASYYPLFSVKTFQDFFYHTFPSEVVTTLTPTFIVLAIVFIIDFLRDKEAQHFSQSKHRLMLYCVLGVVFGLVSVAFERKAFNYQFTRFFWALMPLVAAARLEIGTSMRSSEHRLTWLGRSVMVIAIVIAVLYSPVPRMIHESIGWSTLALRNDTNGILEREAAYDYDVAEMRELASKYKHMIPAGGNLLVWGNQAQLYYEFGQTPTTIELVNAMFMTSHTPQQWTDTLAAQWRRQRPMLFICEQNDARPLITQTTDDSYAALMNITSLRSVLEELYEPIATTKHFRLYRLQPPH